MKIAITQPSPDSMTMPELEKLARNLSSMGYDGVEFKVCNPMKIDIDFEKNIINIRGDML